jgi:ABC-type Na+ transport system ATPase subunit NatA
VIEVSHLTKDFCGRTAVADVPFSNTSGGVSGFLGPGRCRECHDRTAARAAAAVLIFSKKSSLYYRHEPGQR